MRWFVWMVLRNSACLPNKFWLESQLRGVVFNNEINWWNSLADIPRTSSGRNPSHNLSQTERNPSHNLSQRTWLGGVNTMSLIILKIVFERRTRLGKSYALRVVMPEYMQLFSFYFYFILCLFLVYKIHFILYLFFIN